ncbi:MAG: hypothetical protein J3K34DRAFT_523459 [Monoraphidium minutum]|nr:MAG: hypothetical protein J3K34DRAFT_523459 [Monoraphidium minutum]
MAAAPTPAPHPARARRLALRAAAGAAAALLAAAAAALAAARAAPAAQLLAAWLAAEAAFGPLWASRAAALGAAPAEHRPAGHDGAGALRRFLRLRRHFPLTEHYLRPWFLNAPLAAIKRGNVLEFMSYGFWYRTTDEVAAAGDLELLEGAVELLARESGIPLEDGHTPGLRYMSHLRDDLPAAYRPLAFYALTELLALMGRAAMWAAGFTRHVAGGHVFYTRAAAAAPGGGEGGDARAAPPAAAPAPVLLLHGVGAGVLPYLWMICSLASTGRAMVVPEFEHVSMRLVAAVPTVEQLVGATAAFLAAQGHAEAHVVAHSYGTLVASRLAQRHPKALASLALLDPVCFAVYMPALLHSFLYSFPRSGNALMDVGMYLVSRELHMTATFCRQFYWSDYNLWPEHLPSSALVSLSGRDPLCEAAAIRDWLAADTDVEVEYEPSACHAELLLAPARQAAVLARWAAMAAAADAGGAACGGAAEGVVAAAPLAAGGSSCGSGAGESAALSSWGSSSSCDKREAAEGEGEGAARAGGALSFGAGSAGSAGSLDGGSSGGCSSGGDGSEEEEEDEPLSCFAAACAGGWRCGGDCGDDGCDAAGAAGGGGGAAALGGADMRQLSELLATALSGGAGLRGCASAFEPRRTFSTVVGRTFSTVVARKASAAAGFLEIKQSCNSGLAPLAGGGGGDGSCAAAAAALRQRLGRSHSGAAL